MAERKHITPKGADSGAVNVTGVDAYAPQAIAQRVEAAGVTKAALPLNMLAMLGVLAGVFIGFGAAFYTLAMTGSTLGFGPAKLLGGVAFSLGLILVVIAGAELFTGNNLIVMAWADGQVTTLALLRNWLVTFVTNGAGGVALAVMVHFSGALSAGGMAETAAKIAEAKMSLAPVEAFLRGVLCNALVCLAVWLAYAAHTATGKMFAIIFPISAFVALGFEHSIANFYLIPVGLMAGAEGSVALMIGNLVPVTLGNIIGGAGGVAIVYWTIYGRQGSAAPSSGAAKENTHV